MSHLQAMVRANGLDAFPEKSDMLFHWFFAGKLPEAAAGSPKDDRLRQYTRRSVQFATLNIQNLACVTLDMSKLADLAIACMDEDKSSTGFWVELLACRFLQVGLPLSLPSG